MGALLFLFFAALLEVGGDALMRMGIKGGRTQGLFWGALALAAYGIIVNLPKWDFGRLLGVYIAVFYAVSQGVAYFVFHEKLKGPSLVGGGLILAGGVVLTLWRG